ncbi:MAG: thiamine-phosphate kinase [Verrucomicrobia bacterium]|nr:thiamine-phosphate kinase [Verrucomicrobiota bacterium]
MSLGESTRLHDIGEDELIARLTGGLRMGEQVICGPGDDCAVLTSGKPGWLDLLKTDVIVEDVHFRSGENPEAVGWKAMARPLSDIAAMGGIPTAAVVTIVTAENLELAVVEGWYRGLQRAAEAFGVSVVGGETSSSSAVSAVISVAMTGRVEKECCVYRSGAKVGDAILVTGKLGGSLQSGRHLNFTPRLAEARWLTKHFKLNSLMDLSDGLAKDLPRMMKMSGTGYRIDNSAVPCHTGSDLEAVLNDGEDYELLFSIKQDATAELLSAWQKQFGDDPKLSVIGEVSETTDAPLSGGWEHFSNSPR